VLSKSTGQLYLYLVQRWTASL